MKKLRLHIYFLICLLTCIVIGLSPASVRASSDSRANPIITIPNPPAKDISGIEMLCSSANARIHENGVWAEKEGVSDKIRSTIEHAEDWNLDGVEAIDFLTYSKNKDNVNIEVNMLEYRKLGNKEKQIVMQSALSVVNETENISTSNKNKIYHELCDFDKATSRLVRELDSDVRGDFSDAYNKFFKPWSGTLGIALGVLALAIFTMLAIATIIDIAFLTLPFMQGLILSNTDTGSSDKNVAVKFISREALNALKESESTQAYANPIGLYLRSKTKQWIAIAVCLTYLISGQIFNLLGSAADYIGILFNL